MSLKGRRNPSCLKFLEYCHVIQRRWCKWQIPSSMTSISQKWSQPEVNTTNMPIKCVNSDGYWIKRTLYIVCRKVIMFIRQRISSVYSMISEIATLTTWLKYLVWCFLKTKIAEIFSVDKNHRLSIILRQSSKMMTVSHFVVKQW